MKSTLLMFLMFTVFEVYCDVIKLTLSKGPNKDTTKKNDWQLRISHGENSEKKPNTDNIMESANFYCLEKGESFEFNSKICHPTFFDVIVKIAVDFIDSEELKFVTENPGAMKKAEKGEVTREIESFKEKEKACFFYGNFQHKKANDFNREDVFLNFITDESTIDRSRVLLFTVRLYSTEVIPKMNLLVPYSFDDIEVGNYRFDPSVLASESFDKNTGSENTTFKLNKQTFTLDLGDFMMAFIDETYVPPTLQANSERIRKLKSNNGNDSDKNTVETPSITYGNNELIIEYPSADHKQPEQEIII